MELRTIKYFLTIAEKENITSAAKVLHITQPTLSRQMTDLEEELGTTLFVRTNRNTLLTEDGILFKQRAEDILALVEKTENEFHIPTNSVYGNINIGSVETEAMHIIINTIKNLHKGYPDIKYNFYNGNSNELMERLNNGLLDFCLRFGSVNEEQYNFLHLPAIDTTGVVMRKDSPYANLEGITLEHLKEMPLIISARFSGETITFERQPKEYYDLKNFNIIGTFNQIYNALLMVRSGICNAISIGSPLHISKDSELCFIPFSPPITITSSIIWKKHQILSKANRVFISELKSQVSKL